MTKETTDQLNTEEVQMVYYWEFRTDLALMFLYVLLYPYFNYTIPTLMKRISPSVYRQYWHSCSGNPAPPPPPTNLCVGHLPSLSMNLKFKLSKGDVLHYILQMFPLLYFSLSTEIVIAH